MAFRVPLLLVLGALLLPASLEVGEAAFIKARLRHGFFNASIREQQSPSLRRNLLGEARMWLYGHVLTRGYYYTDLWVGTPRQHFSLIVDTGSTVTYVPCSTCTECGHHEDSPFIPTDSSTYQAMGCHSANCPQQQCDNQERCIYTRHYAEESSSTGLLVEDVISFGDVSTINDARITFGCETRETGDLFTQKADGIIGLGRGPLSVVDQLVEQGNADNSFSLCYGGMETGGGAMIVGSTSLPAEMKFTPLDPIRSASSAYYNLVLEELRVGGKALSLPDYTFDQGYGTVLDSGTTFTYLPKQAFAAFTAGVSALLKDLQSIEGPEPEKFKDICYAGASTKAEDLKLYFPKVEFAFGGGVVYELDPENYLFRHRKVDGAYCLGFFENQDGGTLLGGILVRNTLVTYDRTNAQVGFWKTNCEHLFDVLPDMEGTGTSIPNPEFANKLNNTNTTTDTSDNPDESAGCSGCASLIVVSMTLGTQYADFSELREQFLSDMARELNLDESQVEISKFGRIEDSSGGVALQLRIVPRSPANYIMPKEAERIKAVLQNSELGLRDSFAKYNVTSVRIVSAGDEEEGGGGGGGGAWRWLVGAAALLAVVAVGGAVAGVAWHRRRSALQARRYTTFDDLNDDEDEEKEALDGERSVL